MRSDVGHATGRGRRRALALDGYSHAVTETDLVTQLAALIANLTGTSAGRALYGSVYHLLLTDPDQLDAGLARALVALVSGDA